MADDFNRSSRSARAHVVGVYNNTLSLALGMAGRPVIWPLPYFIFLSQLYLQLFQGEIVTVQKFKVTVIK